MSGQEAEKKVSETGKIGSYLVRFSKTEPGSYAITVYTASKAAKHYRIHHKSGLDYLIGLLLLLSLSLSYILSLSFLHSLSFFLTFSLSFSLISSRPNVM